MHVEVGWPGGETLSPSLKDIQLRFRPSCLFLLHPWDLSLLTRPLQYLSITDTGVSVRCFEEGLIYLPKIGPDHTFERYE